MSIVRKVFFFNRKPNYPRSLFHNRIPINKTSKYRHRHNSFTGGNLRRFFPRLVLVCADSNRIKLLFSEGLSTTQYGTKVFSSETLYIVSSTLGSKTATTTFLEPPLYSNPIQVKVCSRAWRTYREIVCLTINSIQAAKEQRVCSADAIHHSVVQGQIMNLNSSSYSFFTR